MWVTPHEPLRRRWLVGKTSREAYVRSERGSFEVQAVLLLVAVELCWARLVGCRVGFLLVDRRSSSTRIVRVLSVRATTWCGPLYGGCRARRMVSCRRKTWLESWRSLWTKVAGDE